MTVPVMAAMADADTEWEPIIPLPYGSEAMVRTYEWNDNDDAMTQVKGMVRNLYMDEDIEIKRVAADYSLIMTGIRRPQGIIEDGSALIGVYYWENDEKTDEDIIAKISLIGEYPLQTRFLGNNQTAVYLDPSEPLDESAFQRNFDKLKEMCNID